MSAKYVSLRPIFTPPRRRTITPLPTHNAWSFVTADDLLRRLTTEPDDVLLRRAADACGRHAVCSPVRDFCRAAFIYAAGARECLADGAHESAKRYLLAMHRQVELAQERWIPFLITV
jgi:hypothetical protein